MAKYLTDEAHEAMMIICHAATPLLPADASTDPCWLAMAYLSSGTDAGRFLIAAAFVAEGWESSGFRIEASEHYWREIEVVENCVKST